MKDNMGKIASYYKNNLIVFWGIGLIVLFQVYYINSATANVPIMDYWRYINEITEKVFRGRLTWADLWTASAGTHINPLLYLALIINMKLFGLNTRVEIFLGIFIMLLTTVILYGVYRHVIIHKFIQYSKLSQILFLAIVFAVFNANQWEILTLEFSFVFMTRILMFITIFILLDWFLRDLPQSKKRIMWLGVLTAIVIPALSQGYFPSMVGAVLFTLLVHGFLYGRSSFNYIKEYLVFLFLIGVGSVYYLSKINLSSEWIPQNSISQLFNADFVMSILIMLSGSIMPIEFATRHGGIYFQYSIGLVLLLLYLGAIILFFRNKIWKDTYLPLTLISYAYISIALIYYARVSIFSLQFSSASRYVVETTLGLIGMLWIYIWSFLSELTNHRVSLNVKKAAFTLGLTFIFVFLLNSMITEIKAAPYRKMYAEEAIQKMLNIETQDDKSLSIFQAGNPQYVRNGIELMKKYHLGIFHNEKQLNKYLVSINKEIGSDLVSAQWLNGKYDDGWLGKSSEFRIRTGTKGKLLFTGYYPHEITGNETGTIYVNDKLKIFSIETNSFTLELNAPPQTVVNVKIDSDFSFAAKPPDQRILSFILSDVKGQ